MQEGKSLPRLEHTVLRKYRKLGKACVCLQTVGRGQDVGSSIASYPGDLPARVDITRSETNYSNRVVHSHIDF